jgi:hypothetical protein
MCILKCGLSRNTAIERRISNDETVLYTQILLACVSSFDDKLSPRSSHLRNIKSSVTRSLWFVVRIKVFSSIRNIPAVHNYDDLNEVS